MISIYSRKILQFLTLFVVGLTLANLTVQLSKFLLGRNNLLGLTRLFDVDHENNIPSWYSSITILLCSLLLWLIFSIKNQCKDRYARYWQGLSIIFLLLSLDEAASFHELLIPVGHAMKTSGFLFLIWVVPGIIFALTIALIYFKFWMALPAKIRYLFLAAGVIYVLGAAGMEMVGGYYIDSQLKASTVGFTPNLSIAMILAMEEFLEMIGILVFIYALMSYINLDLKEAQFSFSESKLER